MGVRQKIQKLISRGDYYLELESKMLVVFLSFDAVSNKLQYHDGEIFLCLPQKLVKAQSTF